MEMKKGLIIASTMASMLASTAFACDGTETKKPEKKLTDDTIALGDKPSCKGKEGCKAKKLVDDSIQLGDKGSCKGKDGCKAKK